MRRYDHGGDIYGNKGIEIDFSVNLNPLGMPECVKRALMEHMESFSRYPDRDCRELREAISLHEGVSVENIVCGNGAADLIYRLCFGLRPKAALVCAPTFSEYERAVLLSGGEMKYHKLKESEKFAVTERFLDDIADEAEMVFICSPNNPTGQLISSGLIDEIAKKCEKTNAILVVDECFLDFTEGQSAKRLMSKHNNIVILKAFTKSYSMAGLRLGYMMTGGPAALEAARGHTQPWSVSAPAQAAGIAALSAAGWLSEARELTARERQYLTGALGDIGMTVYPSDANFILMRHERHLHRPLIERGILIRECADYEGLSEKFARVCIRRHEENERLIVAIMEVLNV